MRKSADRVSVCELYPGICFTTEEKARKILSKTSVNTENPLGITKLNLQLNMASSDWPMFKITLLVKLYHIQIFGANTVFIERVIDNYVLCILETADKE